MSRIRADLLLVELGLAPSRSQAQALIMAGKVHCGDRRIDKAGTPLAHDTLLTVDPGPRFVSRGGDKLAHGLSAFAPAGLDPQQKICVDVGASTGGFTDCLLQHGAARVYAVDVGYGQLHPRLRADPRVVTLERTNARKLRPESFDERIELVVVDASFIGIGKLIEPIVGFLPPPGELVVLIKPQFEVGKQAAARCRGVIRDANQRLAAIAEATRSIEAAGCTIVAATDSPLRGPKGNLEHLVYARPISRNTAIPIG